MSSSNSVLAIAVIGVLTLIGSEAHAGQPAGSAQMRQSAQRTSMQKKQIRTLMQQVAPAQQAARPTSTPSHGGWGPWETTQRIRAAGTDSSSRLPNPKWNDIVLKRGRVADQTVAIDSLATSGADEPVQASGPMEVLSWTWGVDSPVSAVHGEPASSQRYADVPPASAQTAGDRAFRSRSGHLITQGRHGESIEIMTVSRAGPAGVPVETLDIAHEGFLDERPSAAEDTGPRQESISFVYQSIKLEPVANAAASATVDPASVAWVSGKGGTR